MDVGNFANELIEEFGEMIQGVSNRDNTLEGITIQFAKDATPEQIEAANAKITQFNFEAKAPDVSKARVEISKDALAFTPLMQLTVDKIIDLPRKLRTEAFERWCRLFSDEERELIKNALEKANVSIALAKEG